VPRGRILLGAAGVAAAWLAIRRLRPFRVEVAGVSMAPAINPGDWLVATRTGSVRRGCVVVLADPRGGRDLVKRIAAVPGDVVEGRELASGEFLVLGDNLPASTDGRTFGPVNREDIEGVVRLRYWPRPAVVR
jgi:signal peptidase I